MTKEKLTIELFGKTKFWIGVSLGLATTLILFFFFAYGREILRGATTDLIIPTKMEFIAYNLFFSAVSITIGFGLTAWYLFHNPISFKISRRWNQFIRTYLIVSTLILLVAILRTGNFVFHLLYRLDGYDSHLSFVNELPELLILMPTVFFLNIWTPIRLKYRAGIWFWYSIMVYACGTIALGFSSPIDQSIMNGNWEKKNAPYREIVNNEIIRARELGINVHQEEIEKLIYNRRQKAIDQAMLIKKKFRSDKAVSANLIVIELLLLKKSALTFVDIEESGDQEAIWPYALPRDVYKQMMKSEDSVRIQYLKEIILEIKDIFKEQEKELWPLGDPDGLTEKYNNRASMKFFYNEIELETKKYLDSLKIKD